jgi:hypothetical protein
MAGSAIQTGINNLRSLKGELSSGGYGFGTDSPDAVNFKSSSNGKGTADILASIDKGIQALLDYLSK